LAKQKLFRKLKERTTLRTRNDALDRRLQT